MLERHEGETCDAVLLELERRTGHVRSKVELPEETKSGPPVEIVFHLGDQPFAMEQTLIEPFEGHMQLDRQAEAHFGPILAGLKDKLPPQFFELHIPLKAMMGVKKNDLPAVQNAIIAWVLQNGPELPIKQVYNYIGAIPTVAIEGVPFNLRMLRFDGLFPRLQIVHVLEDQADQDNGRVDRIRRACDKKFPKLAEWKARNGSRTILILEDNDIQLTSPVNVGAAFAEAVTGRQDIPDETYLVSSCMDPWHAWPVFIDGRSYHDLSRCDLATGWSIDQSKLKRITSR